MNVNRPFAIAIAVIITWGCGEPLDELTPYVSRYQNFQGLNEKLERYHGYLKSPALERQARDIRVVIQAYSDSFENVELGKDKFIRASHNNVKRALARALTQLVEPDFPTFTISAQKQVNLIKDKVNEHFGNLDKLWKESGKTDPFPLNWPKL